MADEWYYAQAGQQLGPVSLEALQGMAASGQVGAGDLVWREGMETWTPAGTALGLPQTGPTSAAALAAGQVFGEAGSPLPYYSPATIAGLPPYAGFWLRFAAFIIDYILTVAVTQGLAYGVGLVIGLAARGNGSKGSQIQVFAGVIGLLIGLILPWLYYSLMESSEKQATLGKMALGIKVVDMDGNRISFGRATGRYWGKIVSGLILGIGYMMAGFTEKKQALHDMMANTLVVRKQ